MKATIDKIILRYKSDQFETEWIIDCRSRSVISIFLRSHWDKMYIWSLLQISNNTSCQCNTRIGNGLTSMVNWTAQLKSCFPFQVRLVLLYFGYWCWPFISIIYHQAWDIIFCYDPLMVMKYREFRFCNLGDGFNDITPRFRALFWSLCSR